MTRTGLAAGPSARRVRAVALRALNFGGRVIGRRLHTHCLHDAHTAVPAVQHTAVPADRLRSYRLTSLI